MKTKLLFSLAFLFTVNTFFSQNAVTADTNNWEVTKIPISTRLAYPFEITYGPDGWLWITERKTDGGLNDGERVIRVDPSNGTKQELIDLASKVYYLGGQDGLLGMAIHPALYSNIATTINNYVFVAYTYDADPGSGVILKLRIARLVYNNSTGKLTADTSINTNGAIIEGLPANTDHNAGRLKIGPDLKLYYTIGDQGANQFSYYCNPNLAQVLPTSTSDYDHYVGKTLRLELNGNIPTDNPTLGGIQSHVYTYGHRNPQGLAFASDGTLYSSEQMDKVDDEVNKIVAGKNYGWPLITGYYDNNGYSYCNWSSSANCLSYTFGTDACPPDVIQLTEFTSGMPADFQEPIGTIGSTSSTIPTGNYNTWPTKAVSSLDIYEGGLIPGWGKSLFMTSLKAATIYRAKLTPDGNGIENEDKLPGEKPLAYEIFHTTDGSLDPATNADRFRDTAFDSDGVTMYVIVDTNTQTSTNQGAILKIHYKGTTLSSEDSFLSNFQLYPNPSSTGSITLRMPNEVGDFNISISNMLGQQLFSEKRSNNKSAQTINTSNLNKGIYFVTVATESGKATKKIVIQ